MKKSLNKFDLTEFQFIGDYVLLKALRPENSTGLVKPEQYDDKPEFGEVISMGENGLLKPGDVVWFGKYSSEHIRINAEDYYVVHFEDIKGVLKK